MGLPTSISPLQLDVPPQNEIRENTFHKNQHLLAKLLVAVFAKKEKKKLLFSLMETDGNSKFGSAQQHM